MSFTLLHVSDLHFLRPEARFRSLADKHCENSWEAFKRVVNEKIKPAFSVVTGDVVATCDKKSLEVARDRLKGLFAENYMVVPGNHDLWPDGNNIFFRDAIRRKHFYGVFGDHAPQKPQYRPMKDGQGFLFYPIDTNQPARRLNFACGRLPRPAIQKLFADHDEITKEHPHAIKIGLAHHPIIPTFCAKPSKLGPYTMLEDAGAMLQALVQMKMDFLLHGHDHVASLYRVALPDRNPLIVAGAAAAILPVDKQPGFFTYVFGPNGIVDAHCWQFDGIEFRRGWTGHLSPRPQEIVCLRGEHYSSAAITEEDCVLLQCDVVGFRDKTEHERVQALIHAAHEIDGVFPAGGKVHESISVDRIQSLSDELLCAFFAKRSPGTPASQPRALAAMCVAAKLLAVAAAQEFRIRVGLHIGTVKVTPSRLWEPGDKRGTILGQSVIQTRQISRIGEGGYVTFDGSYLNALLADADRCHAREAVFGSLERYKEDGTPDHYEDEAKKFSMRGEGGDDTFQLVHNGTHHGKPLYWAIPTWNDQTPVQLKLSRPDALPPLKNRTLYSKFINLASAVAQTSYFQQMEDKGGKSQPGLRFVAKDIYIRDSDWRRSEVYYLLVFDPSQCEKDIVIPLQTDGGFTIGNERGQDYKGPSFLTFCGTDYSEDTWLRDLPPANEGWRVPEFAAPPKRGGGVQYLPIRIPRDKLKAHGNNCCVLIRYETQNGLNKSGDFAGVNLTTFAGVQKAKFRLACASGAGAPPVVVGGWVFSEGGVQKVSRMTIGRGTNNSVLAEIEQDLMPNNSRTNYRFFAVEVRE